MEYVHVCNTNLEIGYNEPDNVYFVYESKGLRPIVYIGSYNGCLQVIGAVMLGVSIEDAIKDIIEIGA